MRGALAGLGGLGLRRRQLGCEHLVGLEKVFDLLVGLRRRDLAELLLKFRVQFVACRLQLLDLLPGALQFPVQLLDLLGLRRRHGSRRGMVIIFGPGAATASGNALDVVSGAGAAEGASTTGGGTWPALLVSGRGRCRRFRRGGRGHLRLQGRQVFFDVLRAKLDNVRVPIGSLCLIWSRIPRAALYFVLAVPQSLLCSAVSPS